MANSQYKAEVERRLNQGDDVNKERNRIITILQEDLERRNASTPYFRNAGLLEYTDVSIGQFIGHREKPDWKKDYQYNLFDPITRDKVMAILSKAGGLYEAQFFSTNKRLARVSELVVTVLDGFYKDSSKKLKEREKNKLLMLDALTMPKAIWYEGWRHQKRTIRDIEERDEHGDISKTKEKKVVHYNGPWGEAVDVRDFIPGSLRIRDVQEQSRIAWAPKMQLDDFRREFPASRFPEAARVVPYNLIFDSGLQDYVVQQDMKEKEVEVIRFFEKWEDKATIIANGIVISKPNSPMPFAHKDYPFAWAGFEELSSRFIYDMPLTMKLLDMQDMNNEVLNLTLDMVWRALNEVVLVTEGDGINDDTLYGGGLVEVNDAKNFQKLEFGSAFGFNSATSMIDRAKRSIESSAIDAYSSGQAQGKETAHAVMVARQAALEITTLFLGNMEDLERDKAMLRVKNQLDRYHRPIEWAERIGSDLTKKAIPVFREITVRDARLENGKRGTVNISITNKPRPKEELDELNVENDKELSQTIDIKPEFIREIDFDVDIVGNSSIKRSKAQEVAESRAFLKDAASLPDLFNVKHAAEDYVRKLGKRTDEALAQPKGDGDPIADMLAQMGQQKGRGGRGAPQPTPSPAQEFAPDSIEAVLNEAA